MSSSYRKPILLGFGCFLFTCVAISSSPVPALAQSPCDEPTDESYIERMALANQAIDAVDFEAALEHLRWASERYDYAILHYSIARALHNLDRYTDAERTYTTFLRNFEGICPDPDGLLTAARDYLSLTIHQQRRILLSSSNEPDTVDTGGETAVDVAEPPDEELDDVELDDVELDDVELDDVELDDVELSFGWFVMGSGVALLGAGLIFDVANLGLIDDEREATVAGDRAELSRVKEDISTAQEIEWVLFGTGVASIITGLVLLVIDDRNEPGEGVAETDISWLPRPDGLQLTLSGSF